MIGKLFTDDWEIVADNGGVFRTDSDDAAIQTTADVLTTVFGVELDERDSPARPWLEREFFERWAKIMNAQMEVRELETELGVVY